ncbi:hypothetical protein V5N11_009759 [Cardamine amara subsp. amara]|uniref:AD domain-containing protein n=1 Tax=Cardamine amara subsp. amara TaxID=228776 RepID=A0ABD1B8R6_CARAN
MKSKKPGDLKNIRMVNANFITELKNLGKVKDPLSKKHLILLDALKSKERDAISNIERIGIGVTVEAQIIFDTLSKTHPVRWVNTDILAMGEVLIRSPYHSDCVFGGPRVVNNEVKRVLGLTRKKLELTDTGDN